MSEIAPKTTALSLRVYWNLLAQHIRPQRGRFGLLLGLMLGSIALQLVNPQIMRVFIDEALAGKPLQLLFTSAVAFIAIALIQQAVAVGVTYLGESVAWTATNALRAEMVTHTLSLDMGFHSQHTPGELIERIDGDITQMANFFSQFVVTLAGNLFLLLGILAALFWEDWRVGLAFSLFAALALGVLMAARSFAVNDWKKKRQAEADLFGFLEETLSSSEDLRSSGAVGYVIRELYRLEQIIFRRDWSASGKGLAVEFLIALVLSVGHAIALGAGYLLFTRGLISIGTVYLFVRYFNLLANPILAMSREMRNFQAIGACVERLNELRNIQAVIPNRPVSPKAEADLYRPRTLPTPDVKGPCLDLPKDASVRAALGLTFTDVHFAYQPDEPVLRGLSFELRPGRVLGLLGRTGSGKSTLARLILRLYEPERGEVRLSGTPAGGPAGGSPVPLQQVELSTLRRRVAMVTQEVQLFRASVRDNLTFFDRSIPDARLEQIMRELGLEDWLRSLPAGLDSQLQPGGRSASAAGALASGAAASAASASGLSAGEAQLLALARVFLRDPDLVILDEASSRLDPATEQFLERAVSRLLRGRSAIIIAHRLGTVQRVDDILILDEGQASEYGPREELLRDPASRFSALLRTGLEDVLV